MCHEVDQLYIEHLKNNMDNNLNLKKKYHDYILTDGGGSV